MADQAAVNAILSFWFGEEGDDAAVARRQARLWWAKHAETDRAMEERFGQLLQAEADGGCNWPATPRGRLARVVLLDQFSRNIFRGRPEAFAWDGQARQVAEAALAEGDEDRLRPIERVFLYMPFEHAENMAHQDLAVARFRVLLETVPDAAREAFQGFLDFAVRHRDIIRRFGRFPHRNSILGRASTAEEAGFLLTPGSSF